MAFPANPVEWEIGGKFNSFQRKYILAHIGL